MSPTGPDPTVALAHLLGADLALRCVEACRATDLTHAALEETVEVAGDEREWHVTAAYAEATGVVQIHGHQHAADASPFAALFSYGHPGASFDFMLPADWLPRPDVPRPRLCGAEPDREDPTAVRGAGACGLARAHRGPHSWQAAGAEG